MEVRLSKDEHGPEGHTSANQAGAAPELGQAVGPGLT